jgi:hypothetical protein
MGMSQSYGPLPGELGLPGYDPLSRSGANLNLIILNKYIDPISASVPHRSRMSRVTKDSRNGTLNLTPLSQAGQHGTGKVRCPALTANRQKSQPQFCEWRLHSSPQKFFMWRPSSGSQITWLRARSARNTWRAESPCTPMRWPAAPLLGSSLREATGAAPVTKDVSQCAPADLYSKQQVTRPSYPAAGT